MQHVHIFLAGSSLLLASASYAAVVAAGQNTLLAERHDNRITLQSAAFSFQLDVTDGLRAVQWENRVTGRTLTLGLGFEIEFDIGLPGQPVTTPHLQVTHAPAEGRTAGGAASFELVSQDPPATVSVGYRWDNQQPVLHKYVTIRNASGAVWNRLLDVRLGTYVTDAAEYHDADWPVRVTKRPWGSSEWDLWTTDPAGHERGYPAYPENQFFAGLAHPSGFATLEQQQLRLVQHPGVQLEAAQSFTCMEAVYGVAAAHGARAAFCDYLRSRMRRVLRDHARPYAILDTCGAQPPSWDHEDFFAVSGAWCQAHIAGLKAAQRAAGLHWDYYCIEFWHDPAGDLKAPDAQRFPAGFAPLFTQLAQLGTLPGLWISSGCQPGGQAGLDPWTFGRNPAVRGCGTAPDGNHGFLCRSAGPVNQMYIDGLTHEVRANGVRLIKLDVAGQGGTDIYPVCNNPHHGHLPGVYSIEANHNAQIQLLTALDAACPDAFIILYWGHRSPWWLLYGDTLFDVGMRREMASLDVRPTLYARSSNVRLADQTRRMVKDLPALGWDSLGVGLGRWNWNNRLGLEGWPEGVLMDICRGGLLAHIWSDPDCFPVADRPQMAEFIKLLKARPTCFASPHFIGDARTDAVWGYCCTDGKRAMISLDNGSWSDQEISLQLNSTWGLPDHGRWDVYGWYPQHVRLVLADGQPCGPAASLTLRPFSAMLLEVVPAGEQPALVRSWGRQALPVRFAEPSHPVAVTATSSDQATNRVWTIRGEIPPSQTGGWFAITTEFRRDGQPFLSLKNKPVALSAALLGQPLAFQPVLDNAFYAAPWQTYRLRVDASGQARPFTLTLALGLPRNVEVVFAGHFVPAAAGFPEAQEH